MSNRFSFRTCCLLTLILFVPALAPAQVATPQAAAVTPAPTQTPEADKNPRKPSRRPGPAGRVTVVPSQSAVAPQVVTIIHRLSGVKILRFLLRQAGESGIVETIDPDTVNNDAHASIIAGWALDDGKTIAARLPQAAAEIEIKDFEGPAGAQKSGFPADPQKLGMYPFPATRTVEPDLTVVTRDGRKLKARLIGLDAETGLSIMQVAVVITALPAQKESPSLAEGAAVQIFAPEPARSEGGVSLFNTFVRVGKIDAKLSTPQAQGTAEVNKLIVQATQLPPDAIGGVACDLSGNTLGIVEAIDGNKATIVSTETIRDATRRVLERQASVPRPVLGVRGELVQSAKRGEFLAHGWHDDQLDLLIKERVGILLTSVMPRTPAALARLQAGDVILKVNQDEVNSAEEFSKLLGEAGSGEKVVFTVKRPAAVDPFSVPVTLGGSFVPLIEWRFEMPRLKNWGLQPLGIETMALTPRVALQLGAEGGMIVVAVQPDSAGAQAGVREGDVIESVDGKLADRNVWSLAPALTRQKKHVLGIVRSREKKKVVVEVTD
jgi:S1-C subfamily serine protease